LIAGSKDAQKALLRLPQVVRARVTAAVNKGDQQEAYRNIAQHLISKTQLIYGKEGNTAYVREWGRVAGMFTKWPSTVASELLLAEWSKSPTRWKMAQKMMFPFIAAAAAQQLLEKEGAFDTKTGKFLAGRSVMGYAPISSVLDITNPPIMKLAGSAMGAVSEVVQGKPGAQVSELKRNLLPFVPALGTAILQINKYEDK
jgi:hypothetical protein